MLSARSSLVMPVLAPLAAASLALVPGGQGKQDSQVSLVRPADPPDPDAKGTLRIRHKCNGERFDVHALKVNADHEHRLWIEDPLGSGTFSDAGALDGGGSQQLKVDTKQGGLLSLAAESLDDLIGRRVEIRHDAQVVLLGVVPPWDLPKKPQSAKVQIDAPEGAPAADMTGKLTLRSKADKGQERIVLRAKHVPFEGKTFAVFVEEDVGAETFVDAGDLEQQDAHAGRWRRDAKQGQALPDGVSFVSDLAGCLLEIRDGDGTVYLRGTIPAMD